MRALFDLSPREWAEMLAELGAVVLAMAAVINWAMSARAFMMGG